MRRVVVVDKEDVLSSKSKPRTGLSSKRNHFNVSTSAITKKKKKKTGVKVYSHANIAVRSTRVNVSNIGKTSFTRILN